MHDLYICTTQPAAYVYSNAVNLLCSSPGTLEEASKNGVASAIFFFYLSYISRMLLFRV